MTAGAGVGAGAEAGAFERGKATNPTTEPKVKIESWC